MVTVSGGISGNKHRGKHAHGAAFSDNQGRSDAGLHRFGDSATPDGDWLRRIVGLQQRAQDSDSLARIAASLEVIAGRWAR